MTVTYVPIGGADWMQQLNNFLSNLSQADLIQLCTDQDAIDGTSTLLGVSPHALTAALAAYVGTTSKAGVLQLATNAEALAGTSTAKAVTPDDVKYTLAARKTVSFAGHNLAGACTLAGVKVGDVVISVTGLAAGTVGDQSSKFENTITVNDQIQQSQASDLSANIYLAVILHKS